MSFCTTQATASRKLDVNVVYVQVLNLVPLFFHSALPIFTIITVYSRIKSALVFADFLNGKKLVCAFNPHLSFSRPLPTRQTDSVMSDDGESDE